jgi:flagellar basal body-associated protein FliL
MARKTSKWLIGISTGVLVIAVGFIALLWMFFDSGSDPGENARRLGSSLKLMDFCRQPASQSPPPRKFKAVTC